MKCVKLAASIVSAIMIATLGSSMTLSTFAAEVSDEISPEAAAMASQVAEQVTAKIIRQDGSVIELQPEFHVRRADTAGRSAADSEGYILDFAQTYSSTYDSAVAESKKMQAQVRGSVYFSKAAAGRHATVDRLIVDFEADRDVQVSRRKARYSGGGQSKVVDLSMHYDSGNGTQFIPAYNNLIDVSVSANLGYANVRDSLVINMRNYL